jgi:quercetin dioxygenase-like cupin family protein
MADEWDRLFETFTRPRSIKRHTSGNYRIEDKDGRVMLWVYPKGKDTANHKKPSDEEALTIVKAIAKMSKRKTASS